MNERKKKMVAFLISLLAICGIYAETIPADITLLMVEVKYDQKTQTMKFMFMKDMTE